MLDNYYNLNRFEYQDYNLNWPGMQKFRKQETIYKFKRYKNLIAYLSNIVIIHDRYRNDNYE